MWEAIRFLIGIIGLSLSIFVVFFHKSEFRPIVWLCLWAMFAVIGVIELKVKRKDTALMYFTVVGIMLLGEISSR